MRRALASFCSWNFEGVPGGFELAYDSGRGPKATFRGVERPEDVRLEPGVPRSGILSVEPPDKDVAIAGGRCLSEECLGGDGARVDVECEPLVYRRDILVVRDDVPITGSTGGVRGLKEGVLPRERERPFPLTSEDIGGCSSSILRSDSTVRKGWVLSSEGEESDCEGSSSIGVMLGGMRRWWWWCGESGAAVKLWLEESDDRERERERCCCNLR